MPPTFHVLTIFPDLARSVFEHGVLRRAVLAGHIAGNIVDLRDFTSDRHRSTDDMPYAGGPGMVMLAEPIFLAVEQLRAEHGPLPLIYLSPAGERLTHALAAELAAGLSHNGDDFPLTKPMSGTESIGDGSSPLPMQEGGSGPAPAQRSGNADAPSALPGLILLCGRYEGVDQRVIDHLVDREVSIGDYVISGGELAAMVLIDAVARLLPGVLGNDESSAPESFAQGLLDWPHYTRPEVFRGFKVPEVLLSGNHAKIKGYREECALLLTYSRRPELLSESQLMRAKQLLAEGRHKEADHAGIDPAV